MANTVPKEFKKELTDRIAPAVEATHKVALLLNTYTFVDGHDHYADVSAWEHAATGNYVAGGATLAGRVSSNTGVNAMLDATDLAWGPGVTLANVRYLCWYETAGGKIRGIFDLGAPYSCTNSTFTLQWSANGLLKIS